MTGESDKPATPDNDATGEFFSVGSPLHAVKAGYIRRQADDLLVEAVNAGRFVHVLAPNRSGKSSLIAATVARLENDNLRVAVLDLEQNVPRDSETDAGRWYYNLAYRLLRQLRIRLDLQEWWQDKSMLGNSQRLLEFYTELILGQVEERIVVFIDGLQLIEQLPFADHLLASVRAAHDTRSLDPDFSRLTFVLVGECDPLTLAPDPLQSPFSVAQAITLGDFEREQLELFTTELNLPAEDASRALDRIYYWTSGHPYLTQKLARAISRADIDGDLDEAIDHLVVQQVSGRAATRNEPHLSHIHRRVVSDPEREALLNLYGRIRKGVEVATDLGSSVQRKLLAMGLVVLEPGGSLQIRNRLYEAVFSARWANENLPSHWRFVAYVAAIILVMLAVPFWYTQWLPNPYVRVLTSVETEPETAQSTWLNLRSFPGHTESADAIYRQYLIERAELTDSELDMLKLAPMATALAGEERLGDRLTAEFWDRRVSLALRDEDRDEALLASIRSFSLSTRERRNRAAMLVGRDYPLLVDTLSPNPVGRLMYDPVNQVISRVDGASVSQWIGEDEGFRKTDPWELMALDVQPLVRRVAVDNDGDASRIGLSLTISHQRLDDLFIRLTAPSGKSVVVVPDVRRSSSIDEIRISPRQLRPLTGEDLRGTWSLSIRDQSPGVAGHLVGWNLTLNSQVLVESFQRGMNIPNPVEAAAESVWIDQGGRYAAARSRSGDNARLWDLAFGRPLGAVAATSNEDLVGLDATGQQLVTATSGYVHVWDVATGQLANTLPIDVGAQSLEVLGEAGLLFVRRQAETQMRYEVWSLSTGKPLYELEQDVVPVLHTVSADGRRLAVADFDRSVRVWDLESDELLAQVNLNYEPAELVLDYDGSSLGVVYQGTGVSQWRIEQPDSPVFEEFAEGDWRFAFSPGGDLSITGFSGIGFQVRRSVDGFLVGPLLGRGIAGDSGVLAFSDDERSLLTPHGESGARLWDMPLVSDSLIVEDHSMLSPALDAPLLVTPGAKQLLSADRGGHLHVVNLDNNQGALDDVFEEVSFLGHQGAIRFVSASSNGALAATLGEDDSLLFWDTRSGEPTPSSLRVPASSVVSMQFLPGDRELAVLTAGNLLIVDSGTGELADTIEFLEPQTSAAFVTPDSALVGSIGGTLQLLGKQDSGWSATQIWRGDSAISHLAVSGRSGTLVVADASNQLYQLSLSSNEQVGPAMPMPSTIREIVLAPTGNTFFVRTDRWVHQVSITVDGLLWRNAVLVPRVPGNANLLPESSGSFLLPTVTDSEVVIARFAFRDTSGPGLFGNQLELLQRWQERFAVPDAAALVDD